jgi:hypothetical protein
MNDELHEVFLREFGNDKPQLDMDEVSNLLDKYTETPVAHLIRKKPDQQSPFHLSEEEDSMSTIRDMPSEKEIKRRLIFEEPPKNQLEKSSPKTFDYDLEEESNEADTDVEERKTLPSLESVYLPEGYESETINHQEPRVSMNKSPQEKPLIRLHQKREVSRCLVSGVAHRGTIVVFDRIPLILDSVENKTGKPYG